MNFIVTLAGEKSLAFLLEYFGHVFPVVELVAKLIGQVDEIFA